MTEQPVLLGRSTTTPVDNKSRRVVTLPGGPSEGFILNAKCRIVRVSERISISAADLPGETGGTYAWSTTSSKIRLVNTTGPTLVVEALTTPGTARDSEVITVTRSGSDGSKNTKTVALTVTKVMFGRAANQLYGYDDFETPLDSNDDHVSVKSEGQTFVAVKIEGGVLGADFEFVCDNGEICVADPAPESSEFSLRLSAKRWQKMSTVLRAKVKCPAAAVFASITVHVYTERVVKVVVAKVVDNKSPGTALKFATADYTSHQSTVNEKLREAVVKYELRNFNAANNVVNVEFDTNLDGSLDYDINAEGGAEFNLIQKAVVVNLDEYCVVIVRKMRSLYYLDQVAKRGDTSITVKGSNIYTASMPLGTGLNQETIDVTGNTGNVGHLAVPLQFDHAVGEKLEFPAAAWGANPVVIAEGTVSLDELNWTLMHEIGHVALMLQDVVDPTDVMHFDQSNTDYRLRFRPRESSYSPGATENQWDTIPRPLPGKVGAK